MTTREQAWSQWMRAAGDGDTAAYDRLLRELSAVARRIVRRTIERSGGNVDLEDVVQEILLAVHLKRHTWDTSQPLLPWLNAIMRYKMIDVMRRRGRRNAVPIEDYEETLAADEPEFEATASRDAERSIAALPKAQREAVEAIGLRGESFMQAAERLGVKEGTVRVALHRGLAALARMARSGDAH